MSAVTVRDYRARARQARERRTDHQSGRLPRAIAVQLDVSGLMVRRLLKVYRPSHTAFGDTPATQWARLVDLYHATHIPTGDPR